MDFIKRGKTGMHASLRTESPSRPTTPTPNQPARRKMLSELPAMDRKTESRKKLQEQLAFAQANPRIPQSSSVSDRSGSASGSDTANSTHDSSDSIGSGLLASTKGWQSVKSTDYGAPRRVFLGRSLRKPAELASEKKPFTERSGAPRGVSQRPRLTRQAGTTKLTSPSSTLSPRSESRPLPVEVETTVEYSVETAIKYTTQISPKFESPERQKKPGILAKLKETASPGKKKTDLSEAQLMLAPYPDAEPPKEDDDITSLSEAIGLHSPKLKSDEASELELDISEFSIEGEEKPDPKKI